MKLMSLHAARNRGLQYIQAQQNQDGGFTSQSSPSRTPWQVKYQYRTTFVPAVMLASLATIDDPVAAIIRAKLAEFLAAQRSPNGAYNYWAKTAPERKTFPYPDDLDDTFYALLALQLHDPKLVKPGDLADVVKLLVACEAKVGGPYRTWLVQPVNNPNWQDTDLAVNANISAFINLVGGPLPNMQALFATRIVERQVHSPYYASEYPLLYFLARATVDKTRVALNELVANLELSPEQLSPLETALIVSTLLQINPRYRHTSRLVHALMKSQAPDGSWPAAAFCLDPARNSRHYFHGSSALTTAPLH